MTHPTDGFESAAASVLADGTAAAPANGNGAAPGAPLSGADLERARKNKKATGLPPGRPRKDGAPPSSRSSASSGPAHTAPVETPKPVPPPPPIDPARIEAIFRDAVNPFLVKLSADPFTPDEIRQGAKVIAPLWDDYAAKAAAQGTTHNPLLIAFAMWAIPAAGPRVLQVSLEVWRRVKAKRAAAKGAGFDAETTRQENERRAAAAAPEVPPETFRDADGPEPVGKIGRGLVPLRTPGVS